MTVSPPLLPISAKLEKVERTLVRPCFSRILAIEANKVDFPLPFLPMMPITSPSFITKGGDLNKTRSLIQYFVQVNGTVS